MNNYEMSKILYNQDMCIICYEDFGNEIYDYEKEHKKISLNQKYKLITLVCGHMFHKNCWNGWYLKKYIKWLRSDENTFWRIECPVCSKHINSIPSIVMSWIKDNEEKICL